MTPGAVYARRYGRVLLADPQRRPEVFTAARARGEGVTPPAPGSWGELRRAWRTLVWPAAA